MDFKVATDIGNSETKMIMGEEFIRQPSVIKRLYMKPSAMETNEEKNVANLLDELVVHVTSEGIKRDGLYFVGKRANITADQVENMNVKLGNKYKHDIPIIMTLSMAAASAVQQNYRSKGKLPANLSLQLLMTSAIPSSEYTPTKAKELEDRFVNNEHIVILYIGDKSVTVKLTFEKTKVTQEGVPALYALIESDKSILDDYNQFYKKEPAIEPEELHDKKFLHVDIGDGTTEYIYTVGLNPVNDACSGERRGVGHATEEATKILKEEMEGNLNINRQQFISILEDSTHNLHEYATRYMKEARFSQAQQILEDVQEKYMTKASANVDIIVIYGGGSIQLKEELYEGLIEFSKEVHCEVLWIPHEYAVNMNVNGMNVLNNKILYKQA